MQIKATHHIGVRTQNMEAMTKFYTKTLGFPITKRWDDVDIIFISIGNTTIELIGSAKAPSPDTPAGGIDHFALHVTSVDDAYAELVAKGVRIRTEPQDFKDVRICFFFDPDGNVLELVEEK